MGNDLGGYQSNRSEEKQISQLHREKKHRKLKGELTCGIWKYRPT